MYDSMYIIIQTKTTYFLKTNFVFEARCLTDHAILVLADEMSKLFNNNPKYFLGIFVDLSEAFDTVDDAVRSSTK